MSTPVAYGVVNNFHEHERNSVRPKHVHAHVSRRERAIALMDERRLAREPDERYSLTSQLQENVEDFCSTTSAHGLLQVASAPVLSQRLIWGLMFALCFGAFLIQAYHIVQKFKRNEHLTNVELRFEAMPFPAVTVCNLNPFKRSLLEKHPFLKELYDDFDKALRKANEMDNEKEDSVVGDVNDQSSSPNQTNVNSSLESTNRTKRSNRPYYQPAIVSCYCPDAKMTCQAFTKIKPESEKDTLCLCPLDAKHMNALHTTEVTKTVRCSDKLWPCYNILEWMPRLCRKCSDTGVCDYVPHSTGHKSIISIIAHNRGCLCTDTSKLCLSMSGKYKHINRTDPNVMYMFEESKNGTWLNDLLDEDEGWLHRVWYHTLGPDLPSTEKLKTPTYSFQATTDQVTLRTQVREQLEVRASVLNATEKIRTSTPKEEMLKQCSFNGYQCSIENDFILHVDPTYGNCYTFNGASGANATVDRPGANHGLRMMIFVNTTEYLPSTESSGVRLTVHPPTEEPFPDTAGFSAPVGSVSSFRMSMKRVERLPAPHGNCKMEEKTDSFIYRDKTYSVEGCYRSCLQHLSVALCGCGDPRLPVINEEQPHTNCLFNDHSKWICLNDVQRRMARNRDRSHDCSCPELCEQDVYTVLYSASTWPASHVQVNCRDMFATECLQYYRNEALIVEIYYESLSYEVLKETPAYGIPSLMSDFGGQLGLWMGVSLITCMEFFMFCWSILSIL